MVIENANGERNERSSTILTQLGGNRFVKMTGARDLVALEDGLQFRLPARFARDSINRVCIKLNAGDLYDVEFGKVGRKKDPEFGVMMPSYAALRSVEGIYSDQLQ